MASGPAPVRFRSLDAPHGAPLSGADSRRPIGRTSPVLADQAALQDFVSPPRVSRQDEASLRLDLLEWGKGVIDCASDGLEKAQRDLQAVRRFWEQGTPDQQSLVEYAERLMRTQELTSFRRVQPLKSDGVMTFAGLQIPTFELFGTGGSSLIPVEVMISTTSPEVIPAHLLAAEQQVANAIGSLRVHQHQIDLDRMVMTGAQRDGHAPPFADAVALLRSRTIHDVATSTVEVDPHRAIDLLAMTPRRG